MSNTHVVKLPESWSFEKVGIKGKIFPAERLTRRAEFFFVETESGHETEIVEHGCDFAYYVLSGTADFVIAGHAEPATAGDLVVIPSATRFTYKGSVRMFAISTPPWWDAQEETVG